MQDLTAFGQELLASQAFSQLIGVELTRLEPGRAELVLDLRPEHLQQHGFVHGGIVSFLADNCLTFSGGAAWGDALTVEYKINYLKPAVGERLIARSTAISVGKSLAVSECKVFAVRDGEEKLVAVAQGTIMRPVRASE